MPTNLSRTSTASRSIERRVVGPKKQKRSVDPCRYSDPWPRAPITTPSNTPLCFPRRLLKLPYTPKRTEIDQCVFLWFEVVVCGYRIPLQSCPLGIFFFACSVLHWNVKFPPGSQVWQPKEPCQSGREKPVPSHLPHHKK